MMELLVKEYKEELVSLDGQIAYCNEAISQKDIEKWEKKEYMLVASEAKTRIKTINQTLEDINNLN